MEDITPEKPGKTGVLSWLKKRVSAFAGLLASLAIMAAILIIYLNNPDIFTELKDYGYAGAFIVSTILNGTIIFPVSNMAVMIAIAIAVPLPWLVGIVGGIGAGIGEMTGYLAGRSGRSLLARSKAYNRVEGWVKKWGWLAVFLLSVVPFVFDVVGIISGALRMPVWRFFIACWLGRTISYIIVIYLAKLGLNALPWFG